MVKRSPFLLVILAFLLFAVGCQGDAVDFFDSPANFIDDPYVPRGTVVPTPTLRPTKVPLIVTEVLPDSEPTPTIIEEPKATPVEIPSELLLDGTGAVDDLRGIARLLGPTTCTAVLIDSSSSNQAPAYVLTSGRCVQEWSANHVYLDIPGEGISAVFNFFADTQDQQVPVEARRVVYSTMKGRDLALIELSSTLRSLKEQGIQPLLLADGPLTAATDVELYSVPGVGFPLEASFLRVENCYLDSVVDLLEAGWHLDDAYRTNCQDIYGGSLGSPLREQGEEEIIALVSTTTTGGRYACEFGAPCELSAAGAVLQPRATYATPVHGLRRCFDEAGVFNANNANCPLEGGRQVQFVTFPPGAIQPQRLGDEGEELPARWDVILAGDYPYYRYKAGLIGVIDCQDDDGYSIPLELAFDNSINQKIGPEEGLHQLCVIGGDSPDLSANWQPVEEAAALYTMVDASPPQVEPIVEFLADDSQFRVHMIFDPPELTAYEYKIGQSDQTDCDESAVYTPYTQEPIELQADNFPQKLCVIAFDSANNASRPFQYIFGEAGNAGQ